MHSSYWGAFFIFTQIQNKMRKLLFVAFCLGILTSCAQKEEADLLVINAKVYTVDNDFSTAEAFAVKDGKFIDIGTAQELQEMYQAKEILDAEGKPIYPGLIDAHAHFYGLGMQLQRVDLTETNSFKEVVQRIVEFQKEKNVNFIVGRGWDQNDWEVKEFPVKDTLDKLFPEIPVAITRIDGHALLANQAALDAAGVTVDTPAEGGEIEKKNGKLTGILIDNPMGYVESVIPKASKKSEITALLDAQKEAFQYGLTTINDAGLSRETIELIDSLQKSGDLQMRIYAMISSYKDNLDYFLSKDPIKTDKLNVRSVKFYADGALGSRGAALKEPYSDKHDHYGALVASVEDFKQTAARIAASPYQMNTHAIGDSANYVVLKTYDSLLDPSKDRRWKVEHSQVIDEEDFKFFNKNVIPSVQPTHATSDMYWAQDRLGAEREKGAYAYKKLLDQAGIIALGTDFPVEKVSPFLTFYAAVARKDTENYPEGGYMKEQALSREETLKGMTIWAAYSNFEEDEKGSIEPGKFADFVILEQDIMEIPEKEIPSTKVNATYLAGNKVF